MRVREREVAGRGRVHPDCSRAQTKSGEKKRQCLNTLSLCSDPIRGQIKITGPLHKSMRPTTVNPHRAGMWTSVRSAVVSPRPQQRAAVIASASSADTTPATTPALTALRTSFPLASAALAAGCLAQVSAPAAFLTSALSACPCPHIQTATQLVGAGAALPAAAAAALGSASRAGPSRLASPTYTRLAAGLAAYAALTAAGIALAAPRLPGLAPAYKVAAAAGLAGLAGTSVAAAGLYGTDAPGAVPAALSTAASLDGGTPQLARAYGGLSSAAAVGSLYLVASGALAAQCAAPPPVRVLLAFGGAGAALFAAVATGVLADAVARGRGSASTFVTLARGGVVGGALGVGAVAALALAALKAGKPVAGGVLPFLGLAVWTVGLAAVSARHLRGVE